MKAIEHRHFVSFWNNTTEHNDENEEWNRVLIFVATRYGYVCSGVARKFGRLVEAHP